jgi:hypothetical protein
MKKNAPRGIRILANLLIIFSIIIFLVLPFSISLVLKGEIVIFPEKSVQFNKIYELTALFIAIIESFISFILAIGVLRLKEKYRRLLVGFTALFLALSIINIIIQPFLGIKIQLSFGNIFNMAISFGFNILILWYFSKPKVKAVFR